MFFWKVAELNALKPEDVDSLMKKMIDEVCSCEHLEMMSSSCCERYTFGIRWIGVSRSHQGLS